MSTDLAEQIDKKNTITFVVEDSGRGMTLEQTQKIFEEYKQNSSDDNRILKGAGLGLAIVKHIMQWHQGSIVALGKSKSGGARFELQFSKTLKD